MNIILRLSPTDNVAIAVAPLARGDIVMCQDIGVLNLIDNIPLGHKVAVQPIKAGEKAIKFACPIGSATCDIQVGQHVHTHNLKSDYLPTFTFDRGKEFIKP
ncbi:MAG: hypothetical protein GC164_12235 [Phycisphaera sp.]|nr:hypothetical protein [Phycisphaera sp.]